MSQDNSEDNVRARPVILDVKQPPPRLSPSKNKPRQHRNEKFHPKKQTSVDDDAVYDEKTDNNYPVEMQLIIRAAQEYARRTYVLGVLEATNSFSKIANKIREMGPDVADMKSAAVDIDAEVERLRARAFSACNF